MSVERLTALVHRMGAIAQAYRDRHEAICHECGEVSNPQDWFHHDSDHSSCPKCEAYGPIVDRDDLPDEPAKYAEELLKVSSEGLTPEDIALLGLEGMQPGESETIHLDDCIAAEYPAKLTVRGKAKIFLRTDRRESYVEHTPIDLETGDQMLVSVMEGNVYIDVIADGKEGK